MQDCKTTLKRDNHCLKPYSSYFYVNGLLNKDCPIFKTTALYFYVKMNLSPKTALFLRPVCLIKKEKEKKNG